MAGEVNLVGSRVSTMRVAYDCPNCANTVTVTITDGGSASTGNRCLVQRPRHCPDCGEGIAISLAPEPAGDDRA